MSGQCWGSQGRSVDFLCAHQPITELIVLRLTHGAGLTRGLSFDRALMRSIPPNPDPRMPKRPGVAAVTWRPLQEVSGERPAQNQKIPGSALTS
jgi:hypothetical protein